MDILLILFFLVSFILIGSGLCSGSEASIFSINEIKAKSLVDQGKGNSEILLKIIQSKDKYVFSIVILNNFINMLGAALFTTLVISDFGESWVAPASILLTILIIFFAEVLPKSIGSRKSELTALVMAKPVYIVEIVFRPLVCGINKINTHFIDAVFQVEKKEHTTSENEIKQTITMAAKEQSITKREKMFIENIFKLNDITAKEIMTPRVKMTTVKGDDTLNDVEDLLSESQHSRLPVIGKDSDDLVGMILLRDLADAYRTLDLNTKISDLKSINRKPMCLPKTTKAEGLLVRFQREKTHLAVIKGEFGGISGVVSLEDVLEIIVDEIQDETDLVADLQEEALEDHKQSKIEKKFRRQQKEDNNDI